MQVSNLLLVSGLSDDGVLRLVDAGGIRTDSGILIDPNTYKDIALSNTTLTIAHQSGSLVISTESEFISFYLKQKGGQYSEYWGGYLFDADRENELQLWFDELILS